jgi:glycosyltransferase involved in cell wall biosynthesis
VIDGAGDETPDILRRYDSQLSYWCSEPDNGQYDAINKGFARATGEILYWINADDMLLPNSLFVVANAFSRFPETQWLSSLKPAVWDSEGYLANFSNSPGFSKEAFLDGGMLPTLGWRAFTIQQESTFFRRSLWEKIGAKIPPYHLAGDFALWAAFYRHAELVGIDYPIGGFRTREGQRSLDTVSYWREALAALNELRCEMRWRRSWTVRLRQSPAAQLPKVKGAVLRLAGYSGKMITNRNRRRAEWELQDHTFLI